FAGALAADHDIDAVIAENTFEQSDIGKPRYVVQNQSLIGEQAGDHQRQRGILGPGNRDRAIERAAADDANAIHGRPLSRRQALPPSEPTKQPDRTPPNPPSADKTPPDTPPQTPKPKQTTPGAQQASPAPTRRPDCGGSRELPHWLIVARKFFPAGRNQFRSGSFRGSEMATSGARARARACCLRRLRFSPSAAASRAFPAPPRSPLPPRFPGLAIPIL